MGRAAEKFFKISFRARLLAMYHPHSHRPPTSLSLFTTKLFTTKRQRRVRAIVTTTRRAGYLDTLLVFSSTSASHMASTAVRFPTPQRVDGSTQRTSVEVTDPLLCPPDSIW